MSGNQAGVAAVLSFVFTGLGQIYNGEIKKGLGLIVVASVGIASVLLGAVVIALCLRSNIFEKSFLFFSAGTIGFGGILICWAGIYSIYDAYQAGSKAR